MALWAMVLVCMCSVVAVTLGRIWWPIMYIHVDIHRQARHTERCAIYTYVHELLIHGFAMSS